MKAKLSLFLILTISSLTLLGQTNVGDTISGTWSASNSPYIISGTPVIPEFKILVIKPGVTVLFQTKNSGISIQRLARLIAKGTKDSLITFKYYQDGTYETLPELWNGFSNRGSIDMTNCVIRNAGRVFDMYAYAEGCSSRGSETSLDSCNISYCIEVIKAYAGASGSSGCASTSVGSCRVYVNNCIISSNKYVFNFSSSSGYNARGEVSGRIRNNLIYDNDFGIHCGGSGPLDLEISNNNILLSTNYGIELNINSSSSYSQPEIFNNIICNNKMGISLTSTTAIPVDYNDIWNNVTDCDGFTCSSTNISADPRFINTLPDWQKYCIIDSLSPCIDKGDPSGINLFDGSVSDIGFYQFIQIPVAPIPVFPENDNSTTSTSNFVWETVGNLTQYQIQIDSVNSFLSPIINEIIQDKSYTEIEDLNFNQSYHWRVRAINEKGNGDWSSISNFSIKKTYSNTSFLNPIDSSILIPIDPIISWVHIDSSTNYSVQVSTHPFFQDEIEVLSTSDNKIRFALTEPATQYFARIRTQYNNYYSDFSEPITFITRPNGFCTKYIPDSIFADGFSNKLLIKNDFAFVGGLGTLHIFYLDGDKWQLEDIINYNVNYAVEIAASENLLVTSCNDNLYVYNRSDNEWKLKHHIQNRIRNIQIDDNDFIYHTFRDIDGIYMLKNIGDEFNRIIPNEFSDYCVNRNYLVLSRQKDVNYPERPLIYIYKKVNESWLLYSSIPEKDYVNEISMFGDFIACRYANKIKVYKRDGDNWYFQDSISLDGKFDFEYYGKNQVIIYGDYLLIGSPYDNTCGESAGGAYLYHRDDFDRWKFVSVIYPDGINANNRFGISVSMGEHYALIGSSNKYSFQDPYDNNVSFLQGINNTPSSPILEEPYDETCVDPIELVDLSWQKVSDYDNFRVQVSKDSSFIHLVYDTIGTGETFISLLNSYDSLLFWRVKVTNANGTSSWSNRFKFKNNYTPSEIKLSNYRVPLYTDDDFFIAKIFTVDKDQSNSYKYSFVAGEGDNYNKKFIIKSDSLFLKSMLTYKDPDTLSIRIKTDDGRWATFEQSFKLIIGKIEVFTNEIDDALFKEIDIYPNPVNGIGTFRYPANETIRLELYNSSGELVQILQDTDQNGVSKVDFSSWNPGIYIFRIISDNRTIHTGKIVRE